MGLFPLNFKHEFHFRKLISLMLSLSKVCVCARVCERLVHLGPLAYSGCHHSEGWGPLALRGRLNDVPV